MFGSKREIPLYLLEIWAILNCTFLSRLHKTHSNITLAVFFIMKLLMIHFFLQFEHLPFEQYTYVYIQLLLNYTYQHSNTHAHSQPSFFFACQHKAIHQKPLQAKHTHTQKHFSRKILLINNENLTYIIISMTYWTQKNSSSLFIHFIYGFT